MTAAALKCLACEQENRPEEELCAACGSSLSLTLCPGCEAVNSRAAQNCYQCGAALGVLSAAAQSPTVPPDVPQPPVSRAWHWSWLLVVLSIGAAGAAHYYLEPGSSPRVSGLIKEDPPVPGEPVAEHEPEPQPESR